MICFPNAKINLGLNIVSKRSDGYHNLETIFYPIGLKDALEIVPSETAPSMQSELTEPRPEPVKVQPEPVEGRFFQTGIEIQGNVNDNLVIKALKLISQEKEIPPIDIHLLKKIPFGAGLGGGSSDAAFMLKLLNDTFSLGYSISELEQKAATLGADCAFFIKNKPAFAFGIGDKLEEIELDLSDYYFVLVKPDVFVPTKDAYSMIHPQQPEISLKEIVQKPLSEWKELMKNDFETPIFKKYSEISTIKEQLYDLGAVYASMSGSGSSVFGFFESKPDLKNIFNNHFTWINKE